jgi:hypothetical protein
MTEPRSESSCRFNHAALHAHRLRRHSHLGIFGPPSTNNETPRPVNCSGHTWSGSVPRRTRVSSRLGNAWAPPAPVCDIVCEVWRNLCRICSLKSGATPEEARIYPHRGVAQPGSAPEPISRPWTSSRLCLSDPVSPAGQLPSRRGRCHDRPADSVYQYTQPLESDRDSVLSRPEPNGARPD